MTAKVTRFEKAAVDRRLKGYVGFQGIDEPPSVTSPGVYAPPRLVPSSAYRRERLGGRELFAWGLALVLAVTNLAGAIAWLTR